MPPRWRTCMLAIRCRNVSARFNRASGVICVACVVTVLVVDLFEVVDVKHHDAERGLGPGSPDAWQLHTNWDGLEVPARIQSADCWALRLRVPHVAATVPAMSCRHVRQHTGASICVPFYGPTGAVGLLLVMDRGSTPHRQSPHSMAESGNSLLPSANRSARHWPTWSCAGPAVLSPAPPVDPALQSPLRRRVDRAEAAGERLPCRLKEPPITIGVIRPAATPTTPGVGWGILV
jgi:hypothetical protein